MAKIDGHLDAVRTHLQRVTATDAARAAGNGALLVDIRPADLRTRDGVIPGALVIDRNQLEWRLDPTSPDRVADVGPDQVVILLCDEGYASSLAARSLQEIGLERATDMIGGFQAWISAGLPTGTTRAT
jgi:rhodanese-related sulfurtransferase